MSARVFHERPETRDDTDHDDPVMAEHHKQMREHVRIQCFDILSEAVANKDSAMSMNDLKDFMKGLQEDAIVDAGSDDKKMAWLENLMDHARNMARETTDLGHAVLKAVEEAKGETLSDGSLQRWHKRLKQRGSSEDWTRTRATIFEFLQRKVPEMRKGWAELRGKLNEVKAKAAALGVTAKDVPALAALEAKEFKSAKFPERRKKVDTAMKALNAREKSWRKRPERETEGSRFYAEARAFLKEARDDGSMAPVKLGAWLKIIFKGRSLAQAKTFFQTTLRTYRKNWKQVRERYDTLHSEMRDIGVPRGFPPVTPEAFLLKSYDQRLAYNSMLEQRLHPEGKPASALCAQIWNAFDQEDWYDAKQLIGILETNFSQHPDFSAMVQYLESHRDDEQDPEKKEELSDDEIVAEGNRMLKGNPAIRILLGKAMEKDTQPPRDFRSPRSRMIGRILYNTQWAEKHGYTNEEEQLKDIKDDLHKKRTEEYVEEGHSKDIEKNMIWGSTADKLAIRKKCTTAQLIYMKSDPESQLAVFEAVDELKGKEDVEYWTDLKPVDMPLDQLHRFVNHDSKRLKWLLWQMHDRGICFSPGSNDVRHETKETETKEVAPARVKKEKVPV